MSEINEMKIDETSEMTVLAHFMGANLLSEFDHLMDANKKVS